jgi:hypothetical protein
LGNRTLEAQTGSKKFEWQQANPEAWTPSLVALSAAMNAIQAKIRGHITSQQQNMPLQSKPLLFFFPSPLSFHVPCTPIGIPAALPSDRLLS